MLITTLKLESLSQIENGYFALIGNSVEYQFVGLDSVVSVAEEAASDSSDDLDFEMF